MGKHKLEEKEIGVKRSSKHKHKRKESEGSSKKASSSTVSGVHSANAWEDVKFESDDRKEKFLRLMGAQKQRKHTGSIQIGEKTVTHTRAGVGIEEIGKNLERQYAEGLEYKSSWNRHAGLGCSNESSSSPPRGESVQLAGLDTNRSINYHRKLIIFTRKWYIDACAEEMINSVWLSSAGEAPTRHLPATISVWQSAVRGGKLHGL
ncbi:Small acidic protein [Taenia crassiceps]|uniref:Small acidic protein n=1 Tax=Taenia crassiceps TaxID=6207 RepID=A0ABR4QQI6_9CEST